MRFAVVTLFPEMFEVLRHSGITGRAMGQGLMRMACWNPRDFTSDRHRSVDDEPFARMDSFVAFAGQKQRQSILFGFFNLLGFLLLKVLHDWFVLEHGKLVAIPGYLP